MKKITKKIELGGRELTFQINEVAQQSTVSIIAKYGETTVLTTVVIGRENKELGYFPLSVEYVERLYAGGRIKGSRWVKREGKPTDEAILTARLIDRSIRPLFPDYYRNEVQIVNTVLSIDGVNSPEIVAALASTCALSLCSIPFKGPVATIRLGYLKDGKDGKSHFVVNPTPDEEDLSNLDLVVSGINDEVVMIEAEGEEVSESVVFDGIELARKEIKEIIKFYTDIRKELGVLPFKGEVDNKKEELVEKILKKYKGELMKMLEEMADKESSNSGNDELKTKIKEEFELEDKELGGIFEKIFKKLMQVKVLTDKKRVDGRGFDEVRKIEAKVGVLPRTHGSAIFSRGVTQVLSIATLGPLSLQQMIEVPSGEYLKRYIHHYFMPPYSVGETGRIGFPSRREIGHGALAEKGIEQVLPREEAFPYTVRVVSEVLSSNGSTSMASTCGSSLALMDAGVPIKEQVAGIAVGIVRESNDKYQLLTDILGIEDFFGEMDFKVAGTKNGITAIQLDVKKSGLTSGMVKETLELARKARLLILEVMNKALEKPRKELSKYAPRVEMLTPPEEKIGEIIGPGGKNIKKLIADTGCEINVGEDGKVSVSGIDPEAVKQAVERIESMCKVYDVGDVFEGQAIKVLPFGIVVEIAPGKEGLLHVTRMGMGYVKDVNEIFAEGDRVKVEIEEKDERGRLKLKLIERL
jgi:polyribonucleotide nucleotidyltransferase